MRPALTDISMASALAPRRPWTVSVSADGFKDSTFPRDSVSWANKYLNSISDVSDEVSGSELSSTSSSDRGKKARRMVKSVGVPVAAPWSKASSLAHSRRECAIVFHHILSSLGKQRLGS